eukprot:PhF_6_TR15965/c0_g1_i1/m.24922
MNNYQRFTPQLKITLSAGLPKQFPPKWTVAITIPRMRAWLFLTVCIHCASGSLECAHLKRVLRMSVFRLANEVRVVDGSCRGHLPLRIRRYPFYSWSLVPVSCFHQPQHLQNSQRAHPSGVLFELQV